MSTNVVTSTTVSYVQNVPGEKLHNIFDDSAQTLLWPVCTNGELPQGLPRQFAKRFPLALPYFKKVVSDGLLEFGKCITIGKYRKSHGKILVMVPVSTTPQDQPELVNITMGLLKIQAMAHDWGVTSIATTKLVSGNQDLASGRGIEGSAQLEVMQRILGEIGIPVSIYLGKDDVIPGTEVVEDEPEYEVEVEDEMEPELGELETIELPAMEIDCCVPQSQSSGAPTKEEEMLALLATEMEYAFLRI